MVLCGFLPLIEANAYVLYKKLMHGLGRNPMDHRTFRDALGQSLIKYVSKSVVVPSSLKRKRKSTPASKIPPSKRFQPPVVPPQPALASAHVWEKTEQLTENGGRSARRRCVVCSKRNHEVRTSHCCKECNAWLCSSDCFAKYHSQSFSYKYRNKY